MNINSSSQVMGSSPGDNDFFSSCEFFLSLSFLPVDSAKTCVHSGKEVADILPAIKILVSTAQGREWAASGRGTL